LPTLEHQAGGVQLRRPPELRRLSNARAGHCDLHFQSGHLV